MTMRTYRDLTLMVVISANVMHAEPVSVKQPQGVTHGFLTVRSEKGTFLGSGELMQMAIGNKIKARLTLSFRDGSVDDETVVYTQAGDFKLIKDHHVQRGPSFPEPIDMNVDAPSGTVTMRSREKDGETKLTSERMDLPPDLANGMIGTLLLNLPRGTAGAEWHMVAPSGKGRLVKIVVSRASPSTFRIAGLAKRACVYRLHVDIGGIAGVVATVVGREPKDVFVWVLQGDSPALVRMVGQLYTGGPVVSIELAGAIFKPAIENK
jgi:hypothetical protein